MNSVIAFWRSSTLRKEPRRIRLLVNSPNQRSTRFSQLELVGTKCDTKRGWRFSQAWTLGCLVGTVVIHHQMQAYLSGELLVEAAQKL